MTVWRLYRFRHPDGRSKDWAVTTLADGSTATRWGKTANRLPGVCQRQGDSQNALERKKLAKGYVFVATVTIDPDGWIQTSGHVAPDMPSPPVNALYWHIACKANHDTCVELAITTRQLVSLIQSLPEHTAIPAAVWMGWQQLIELSLKADHFTQSGQIKAIYGSLPWLFLMALHRKAFAGIEIGIATDKSRELSMDLKTETVILDFFGTDLDRIRDSAEILGLVKPRLNLTLTAFDTADYWF